MLRLAGVEGEGDCGQEGEEDLDLYGGGAARRSGVQGGNERREKARAARATRDVCVWLHLARLREHVGALLGEWCPGGVQAKSHETDLLRRFAVQAVKRRLTGVG